MLGLSLTPPLSHLCLFALVKVVIYTCSSKSHLDLQNVGDTLRQRFHISSF